MFLGWVWQRWGVIPRAQGGGPFAQSMHSVCMLCKSTHTCFNACPLQILPTAAAASCHCVDARRANRIDAAFRSSEKGARPVFCGGKGGGQERHRRRESFASGLRVGGLHGSLLSHLLAVPPPPPPQSPQSPPPQPTTTTLPLLPGAPGAVPWPTRLPAPRRDAGGFGSGFLFAVRQP